jgi:hypothetical protein
MISFGLRKTDNIKQMEELLKRLRELRKINSNTQIVT